MTDNPGFRNYVDLAWVVANELTAGEGEKARGGYQMPWDTRTAITEEAWELIRRGSARGDRAPRPYSAFRLRLGPI